MDMSQPRPQANSGAELERALREWIAASRETFDPAREGVEEEAETAAWRRVRGMLGEGHPSRG